MQNSGNTSIDSCPCKARRTLGLRHCVILLFAVMASYQTAEQAYGLATEKNNGIYVKRSSWAKTLLDSQEKYEQMWMQRLDGLRLSPWYLPSSAAKPSKGVEAGKQVRQTDIQQRDKSGDHLWEPRPDMIDAVVHYDLSNHGISTQRILPVKSASPREPSAAGESPNEAEPAATVIDIEKLPLILQVRTITSDRDRTIKAWVGAQNGIELWLNGTRVFADHALGDGLQPAAEQAQAELDLLKGENQLVLRIVGSRWEGFYFSPVPLHAIHPDSFFRLIQDMERDFPVETGRLRADVEEALLRAWFRSSDNVNLPEILAGKAKDDSKRTTPQATPGNSPLDTLSQYARSAHYQKTLTDLDRINLKALRRSVRHLAGIYGGAYAESGKFLEQIDNCERRLELLREQIHPDDQAAGREIAEILEFQRRVLLSNPLLDFEELLVIKRKPLGDPRRAKAPDRGMGEFLGLPQQSSWQLDRIRQPYGWENEIAAIQMPEPTDDRTILRTLYRPPTPRLVSDIDLHFDAGKLLFSMPGSNELWQVFEMNTDGSAVRQVSPINPPDVQNFDACYSPDDKIVFISTAPFQGVPCSDGIAVAVAYIMDSDGSNIRQLCFDQDHDYCPTVMNDGRILYLRWDYTDLPHQWPRILFTMNPDGTGQREYYGSGSYWPNAVFYARAIPGHPTKIAGIVTGHHVGRVGELVVFDPALGRQEADGVVQRIPGFGEKVEPVIMDKLTIDSWPKSLHPYPLSEEYFLVSCKPTESDLWGIYLVDIFDNRLLLKEIEGYGLFEPIPLRKRKRPPVIPQRVDLDRKDALLYIENIYSGPGLRGVPKGAVKRLRLFTYHFAYPYKSGGQHRVGADGPWEPKRILGTVPVEADGSAFFRVPANIPISMQPLDAEGKALQLMRSWTTAMPGELVSCTGCHENQNAAPSGLGAKAARREPSEILPWHGPARGFDFNREVQPVLDKHCVNCHNGQSENQLQIPDLRSQQDKYVVFGFNDPRPRLVEGRKSDLVQDYAGVFAPSYVALRSMVRVGGLESDLHLLNPGEFGAETSELIQMLKKGHHHVELDAESWERLFTWIDLNAPCHGRWREALGLERIVVDHDRRLELRKMYGGSTDDPEIIRDSGDESRRSEPATSVLNESKSQENKPALFAAQATRDTTASSAERTPPMRSVRLSEAVELKMVYVPSGEFLMGDPDGLPDEREAARVKIERAFWMSTCEITNEQYALFDPEHDSRHEHGTASFNSERALGPRLNKPDQPVVKVSWTEAAGFCDWLTDHLKKTDSSQSSSSGARFMLPTEAQWEYACRAGTSTAFYFGGIDDDFSQFANVSDATMNGWATYNEKRRSADIVPRDARFNDNALVSATVGSYKPNPWGMYDMHGNVWEWTRSDYAPYPYDPHDGRNALSDTARKVVRGGSWYDRPKRCRSAFRLDYPAWQRVYNVGFRVVFEAEGDSPAFVQASGMK